MLVIPDTPAKRREYEEEVVRTFYLSNADLKETQDLMRLVLDARRVSPTTANNALTIKDTPERMAAAARLIAAIDKARPEVVIDVELLEVDRTRLHGVRAAARLAGIARPRRQRFPIDGRRDDHADAVQTLRNLTQADILFAESAGALLPAAEDRHQHADAGQPAAANR